jgi:dihydrofolate synthase/folylpolyglutamate synthase
MVYEDEVGLLDLAVAQIDRPPSDRECRWLAIAALRHAGRSGKPLGWGQEAAVERGPLHGGMAGALAALAQGPLVEHAPKGAEVWLDGGHNPHGAEAVSAAMADMEEHSERPLYLICGMLANKMRWVFARL